MRHEGCAERGGVCDCGKRPCAVTVLAERDHARGWMLEAATKLESEHPEPRAVAAVLRREAMMAHGRPLTLGKPSTVSKPPIDESSSESLRAPDNSPAT